MGGLSDRIRLVRLERGLTFFLPLAICVGCEKSADEPSVPVRAQPLDTVWIEAPRQTSSSASPEEDEEELVGTRLVRSPRPPVNERIRFRVRQALMALCQREQDSSVSYAEILRSVADISDCDLLACAAEFFRSGNGVDRIRALVLAGERFAVRQARPPSSGHQPVSDFTAGQRADVMVSDVEMPASDEEAPVSDAALSHQLTELVSEGVADPDAQVRSAAYDVMRVLGPDEEGIIASRLMRGSDRQLKMELLLEVAGSASDLDMRYSLMALEGPDPEVRQLAMENFRDVSGQAFATVDEALEWRESHDSWSASQP